MIARIATGESEDTNKDAGKSKTVQANSAIKK